MAQETTQLESVLGNLNFAEIAGGGSPVGAAPAEESDVEFESREVASPAEENTAESAVESSESAEAAAPTPSVPETETPTLNYDSDDNPYRVAAQQAAEEARNLRAIFEQAQARAQAQAEEQRREQFFTQTSERIEYLNNAFGGSDEQRQSEIRRLIGEVEGEIRRQADSQIYEVENQAETAAATAAAFHSIIQSRSDLTDAQKKSILGDVQFARSLPNPKAMTDLIARDTAIRNQFQSQLSATQKQIAELQKQLNEASVAKQAQERIASGVDSVGSGVGKPSNAKLTPTEQALRSAFG